MSADATLGAIVPHETRADTPNFDRLAPLYRWLEWLSFGPFLWWCRCAFLGELRGSRQALVIGDGDGRFTARLLRSNPDVGIHAVDASPSMLRALLRRAGRHSGRVQATCVDAREGLPVSTTSFDLIVTHFFLDCISTEEVSLLAQRARAVAAPNALWVVSEFAVPEGWFGRLVALPLIKSLYWAFGRLTGLRQHSLPDYEHSLGAAGFALVQRESWLGGLLVSELWSANSALLQEC